MKLKYPFAVGADSVGAEVTRLAPAPVGAEVTRLELDKTAGLLTSSPTVAERATRCAHVPVGAEVTRLELDKTAGFLTSSPTVAERAARHAHVPVGAEVTRLELGEKAGLLTSSPTMAKRGVRAPFAIRNPQSAIRNGNAFTLIEILVVVVLMSFIILALMAVFNGTQTAFRASMTQSDVLEGGRSASSMIKSDLEAMAPSFGPSNLVNQPSLAANGYSYIPVNFQVTVIASGTNTPLRQSLVGSSSPNLQRTNVLESFFILSRQNLTWTGVGYVVDIASTKYFNPLYRFSANLNVAVPNAPVLLYSNYLANTVLPISPTNTSMSHLMDGVVDLRVRAFDPGGHWMTNLYLYYGTNASLVATNRNVWYYPPQWGEVGFYMFSNTVPASAEINLGVLEDRVIQRAQSIGDPVAQSNYLAQQAGKVHVFRQRAWIRNVDPSAYQ